jgi:hypothetical protein
MDEKPDQILDHIESQRNQLGANLNELETRVRRTTDWRTHFDNNPMLMLAGALGGGILLGAMVSGTKSRSTTGSSYTSSRHFSSAGESNTATHVQKRRSSETIDTMKAALIAFATGKAKEFLNQALPGFDNYLRDAESTRSRSQFSSSEEPGRGTNYGSGHGSGSYNTGGYGEQTSGQGQGANYGQNYGTDYGTPGAGQRNYSTEQTYGNS